MSIRAAIYSHLTTTAQITDTLSSATDVFGPATFPNSPPEKYIIIGQVSKVSERHLGGGSGIATVRIQFDCWTNTPEATDLIVEALRETLDNYRDPLGTGSSQVFANQIHMDDDNDREAVPINASQQGKAGRSVDFLITHQESVTPV